MTKLKVTAIGIIAAASLAAAALATGHDGAVLATTLTVIGGLAGFTIGRKSP